jgi:hypothetical protein
VAGLSALVPKYGKGWLASGDMTDGWLTECKKREIGFGGFSLNNFPIKPKSLLAIRTRDPSGGYLTVELVQGNVITPYVVFC